MNTERREGVLISEGKPQSLAFQVDNSEVILEGIHVKSQCLRVLFGKYLFQEGPHVNSALFTLLNHVYQVGCTGWLRAIDTSQLSLRLVYLQ